MQTPNAERDAALLSLTPIIPVPKYGAPLEALAGSSHRFLVAADGLWLELSRPWLHLRTRIAANCGVRVPVGTVGECVAMRHHVPADLIQRFVTRAREQHHEEQAALITFDAATKQFSFREVEIISNSGAHISYQYPKLGATEEVVLDMHSHAHFNAFFSSQDDKDDCEEVKLSLVIGNCDRVQVTHALRLCALGKMIDLPLPEGLIQ